MYSQYPLQPMEPGMMPEPMPEPMDERYPEIYKHMQPYIDQTMQNHHGGELSEEDLDRMSHEVIEASRIMHAPPRGHNRGTIGDIARAMLIGGMINNHGYDGYPYYPPYYLMPMFFHGRHHPPRRGGHRGHGGHGGRR